MLLKSFSFFLDFVQFESLSLLSLFIYLYKINISLHHLACSSPWLFRLKDFKNN